MRNLIIGTVMVACSAMFLGCSNPHERLVKDLFAVLRTYDQDKCNKFEKEHIDKFAVPSGTEGRPIKNAFASIAMSKDPVKLSVIGEIKRDDRSSSVIEAECCGNKLYFKVTQEGRKLEKISGVTVRDSEAFDWLRKINVYKGNNNVISMHECIRNLKMIQAALEQAEMCGVSTPGWNDIVGEYLKEKPICPAGGTYNLPRNDDEDPTCTYGADQEFPHRLMSDSELLRYIE